MENEFYSEWILKPSKLKILYFIGTNPGTYANKILKELKITCGTVWMHLSFLKKKNLVYVKKKKTNYKIKYIYLTDKGEELFDKMKEINLLLKKIDNSP